MCYKEIFNHKTNEMRKLIYCLIILITSFSGVFAQKAKHKVGNTQIIETVKKDGSVTLVVENSFPVITDNAKKKNPKVKYNLSFYHKENEGYKFTLTLYLKKQKYKIRSIKFLKVTNGGYSYDLELKYLSSSSSLLASAFSKAFKQEEINGVKYIIVNRETDFHYDIDAQTFFGIWNMKDAHIDFGNGTKALIDEENNEILTAFGEILLIRNKEFRRLLD